MNTRAFLPVRDIAITLALFILFVSAAFAGDAAAGATPVKNAPVKLEPIAGTSLKRIVLTEKAIQRLGIETGQVTEEVVIRKQVVSGMVVYPQAQPAAPAAPAAVGGGFGGFAAARTSLPKPVNVTQTANASGTGSVAPASRTESMVVVSLSPGEFDRIARDKPVRITPLYSRDKGVKEMTAQLSDGPPVEDAKRSMLTLNYLLPNSSHGMAPSTRVRVELQLAGPEDKQKVVPYDAVYYDAKGQPWVYVNTAARTYERQRIAVRQVVGQQAVLSDGPAVGTQVVTVGASLLYGTEIFGK